jgi:hypothetical protein
VRLVLYRCYGVVMVALQWRYSDATVDLLWCYGGVIVALQWHYSCVTVVLQWYSREHTNSDTLDRAVEFNVRQDE